MGREGGGEVEVKYKEGSLRLAGSGALMHHDGRQKPQHKRRTLVLPYGDCEPGHGACASASRR